MKGKKTGGRGPGSKNKTTLARELSYAEESGGPQQPVGRRDLAKDILEKFMFAFANRAAQFQPDGATPNADEFERWGHLAVDAANKLAPYQSPTFKAVVLSDARGESQARIYRTVAELNEAIADRGLPPVKALFDVPEADRGKPESEMIESTAVEAEEEFEQP